MGKRFHHSLHFRITGIFLAVLALAAVGYSYWVDKEVLYQVDYAPGEREWFEDGHMADLDSLAVRLGPVLADSAAVRAVLADYAPSIADYEAEVSVFDSAGAYLATTGFREGMLSARRLDTEILVAMTGDDWDFESFPVPADLDAYENIVIGVRTLRQAPADSTRPPTGFVVGAVGTVSIEPGAFERGERIAMIWAAAVILFCAAVAGLILMTWVSRRIRSLSHEMQAFREGDYSRRIAARSADEIGDLGRDFNAMADRLTDVIGKMERLQEFRRQLVANASHDLRTPLASMKGYVETLATRGDSLPEQDRRRYMDIVAANLDDLERLIERLFELSQLDAGQVEFRHEAFPLEELVEGVLDRFAVLAEKRGVALESRAEQSLPLVWADPVRIGQVLQNLVANALDFNAEGGRVEIRLSRADGDVEIAVCDSGAGISAEDLPHVFERFYTADKSRTGRKGTGLGLAIAQSIVAAHGRELTASSAPGEGAVFRFSLPAAPDEG